MRRSTQRAMVLAMLAGVAMTTSACGPEAAAAWGEFARELAGGVIALVAVIVIVIGSIPV